MSASDYFETSLLALIFNGTAIAALAQNNTTSPASVLYVGLHTADPGEGGNQTTSEANYIGYARSAVNRNSGGWSVAGDTASNASPVNFPPCTGGNNNLQFFSVGLNPTGGGTLLFTGQLDASLAISNGITPSFAIGDLKVIAN